MNQKTETVAGTTTPAAPITKTGDSAETPSPNEPYDSWSDYWYGNLYMMLCVYLGYCAVTHLLGVVSKMSSDSVVDVSGAVTAILLQTSALIFFGYVTYTLARRRVKMGAVYAVALLSGIGALFGTPGSIVIWILLCPMAVIKLRDHKCSEELLKAAAQMERDGQIQEALATFQKVADSRTAVAREGRESLENLEAKVGQNLFDVSSRQAG